MKIADVQGLAKAWVATPQKQTLNLTFNEASNLYSAARQVQAHFDRQRGHIQGYDPFAPSKVIYEDFDFGAVVLRKVYISDFSYEMPHGIGPSEYKMSIAFFTVEKDYNKELDSGAEMKEEDLLRIARDIQH